MCILSIQLSNISIIALLCLFLFQIWCSYYTKAYAKKSILTDPHSPGPVRYVCQLHVYSQSQMKKGGGGQDDFSGIGDFTF